MKNNQRRAGDLVQIPGDYQYKALNQGHAVQKAWHRQRIMAVFGNICLSADDVILDVGCGSAIVTSKIAEKVKKVIAIDTNKEAIEFAREKWKNFTNIDFVETCADELNFPNQCFNKIFCLEVIEHLPQAQIENMLRKFKDFLVPYGKIIISTPNYLSHWGIIEKLMDACNCAPKLQDAQHVTKFTKQKLKKLLEKHQYKLDSIHSSLVIAPFMAFLGQKISDKFFLLEEKSKLPFGCNLVAVATLHKK